MITSFLATKTYKFTVYTYSRVSLSRIPRDSIKYFEISVPWHIRFAELRKKSFEHHHHIIIIGFLINMQVQGQHPHQWTPFQIAGLLHAWQISHQIFRCIYQLHLTNIYVIGLLKFEIYWKYCGKEKKLLLRSNFSSFPQYFFTCCWMFMFRQGPDFHFEISGYSR